MALVVMLAFLVPAVAAAQVHTVNQGDTIGKIAGWHQVSQQALRYTNNLWTDLIYPGQTINIPTRYTVKSGDSLYAIAGKYGVDVNSIMAANNLKSSTIYPGQLIYIPTRASLATNNRATADRYVNVSRGGRVSIADLDALARIITAEADSESYETQVAVGAVVLNRVDNPLFPNTIRGVVYQVDAGGRYQFEPVLNGWINNPASASGRQAALDALNGWDPSNGALYFFESWVPNKWLQSRPLSKVMDSFTFTY